MNLALKIRNDKTLLISLLLLMIISVINPSQIPNYFKFINWDTMLTLAALFLITTALWESNYLDRFARQIVRKTHTERGLAISLIILAFALSTFLTNDITLLILVPLSIAMKRYIQADLNKIIIFEALAVNAGSAITPIGNPQNIYIWHLWGASVVNFILTMIPLGSFMLVLLLIFAMIVFPPRKITKLEIKKVAEDKKLAHLSIFLLLAFLVAMNFHLQIYLYPVIFIAYIFLGKRVYFKVDWLLLAIFLLFFVDFTALAKLPAINGFLMSQNLSGPRIYLFSAIFSQFMSNVPATILLAGFTKNYPLLLYGVSIGGNGTIIASLANLIAVRFVKEISFIREFHRYSVIYFIITFSIVAAALYLV